MENRYLNDKLLTDYIQISNLTLHWICVYLTHVPSTIGFLHFPYVKKPRAMIAVRHSYSMILGDDVIRNCKNCLSVDPEPRYLRTKILIFLSSTKSFVN